MLSNPRALHRLPTACECKAHIPSPQTLLLRPDLCAMLRPAHQYPHFSLRRWHCGDRLSRAVPGSVNFLTSDLSRVLTCDCFLVVSCPTTTMIVTRAPEGCPRRCNYGQLHQQGQEQCTGPGATCIESRMVAIVVASSIRNINVVLLYINLHDLP
jgi:hypothetical protein